MSRPFRHDDDGTAEEVWRAAIARHRATPELAVDDGTDALLVVAAHPDDETLGAGGLIARAHARGLRVHVVVATDGEASHPRSPTTSATSLGRRRRAEAEAALRVLAPGAECTFLGLPDRQLAAAQDDLTAHLVGVIGHDGHRVLLAAPWRGDGHGDHDAAGRAAAAAALRTDCRLVEYPIWLWHWGTDDDLPWERVRLLRLDPATRRAKSRAVAQHRSQVAPLSDAPGDEAVLGPALLAHFDRDVEVVLADGPLVDDALDRLHAAQVDPWGVDDRWYERRKRALTCAALRRARYARGLEVGCSVGALASDLADRCDDLLAVDASPAAVARATQRLAGRAHVTVERLAVPEEWPEGTFDLVVLSEVGYFLSPDRLDRLLERIEGSLARDAEVVFCHWRPHPVGLVLDGDAVHERARARPRWVTRSAYVEERFVLETFTPGG